MTAVASCFVGPVGFGLCGLVGGGTVEIPVTRGRFAMNHGGAIGRQLRSDDPIGNAIVTFSGVNANSEIRVYLPGSVEAAWVELCDADHVLTWQVYAPGSPNNTVTIRIVNVAYKIKEFNYTSSVGNVSLPVQQEPDHWYKNPT